MMLHIFNNEIDFISNDFIKNILVDQYCYFENYNMSKYYNIYNSINDVENINIIIYHTKGNINYDLLSKVNYNKLIIANHNIFNGEFKYNKIDYEKLNDKILYVDIVNNNVHNINFHNYIDSNVDTICYKINISSIDDYMKYVSSKYIYHHIRQPMAYRSGYISQNINLSISDNWNSYGNLYGLNANSIIEKCKFSIVESDVNIIDSIFRKQVVVNKSIDSDIIEKYKISNLLYLNYNSNNNSILDIVGKSNKKVIDLFNRTSCGIIVNNKIIDSLDIDVLSHFDIINYHYNNIRSLSAIRDYNFLEKIEDKIIFINFIKNIKSVIIDNENINDINNDIISLILNKYNCDNIFFIDYSKNTIIKII